MESKQLEESIVGIQKAGDCGGTVRHFCFVLFIAFVSITSLLGQAQNPPAPQTARQALIEMFIGKGADAFPRHLTEITQQALIRKGETPQESFVQRISMMGRQMASQGEHFETFDIGSTLLVSEQGRQKVEVIVEHDYLAGEQDEIELSIHLYQNGESEFLPVVPRLTFSMTQEKETWRLSEVMLALRAPLTDPEYLKGLRKEQDETNENLASARVSMIASAESNYSSQHPDRGYTCKMPELFGEAEGATAPEGAVADFAGNESGGYHFSLSGCEGNPASKFRIVAVPTESESGMKAFCLDESRTLRFDPNGKGASCLSRGQIVNQAVGSSPAQVD